MNSFISKVVKDVLEKEHELSQITFVLPSQRSCVFLKEEIISTTTSTLILPKIVSIENYIQELADVSLIDTTQLIFEFYQTYLKEISKDNLDTFETFSQWATIALHDFNDLDSYLVNTDAFFSNLRDVKRLNEWFQDKKPSELALNYFEFFEYLHILYNALYAKLKTNKVGYQGLIYREATNNLEYYIENNKDKKIVFIGFNALNKAEETIFQELLNSNLATIYWDCSENMLDLNNEAGSFLRRYKQNWSYYQKNPFLWIENSSIDNQKIEIIGAPKNIAQVKYAGQLLSKMDTFNKTALILADENLLPLALNSLPSNVKNVNITMGYGIKDIPIGNLFEKLFKAHLNQQKFNKEEEGLFYYKDVLSVLNNPFLNQFESVIIQKVIQRIKLENHIFLSLDDLKSFLLNEEVEKVEDVLSIFNLSKDINEVIKQCSELILKFKEAVVGLEKEYLFRFYTVFQQLETLNSSYKYIQNLKTLSLFFNQLLKNEKLSFQGEPLRGLQLMGMLETRALDFETIIITSVNEGILPGGKNEFSFIPYDIKKYFGLPTYQEKDAIFSYHFQRLLQRSKNVFLIYNTETDSYGSGEKSRFLTKLELTNPSVIKKIVSPRIQQNKKVDLLVEKTPEVLQLLEEFCSKGISPSAIATYIYNPIKFYEQKVLKIGEDDDVEETIAVNTMGTVIHDVLEKLYEPFVSKNVLKEDVKLMFQKVEPLLEKMFEKHYRKGAVSTGKNKLIVEVCKKHIERFLKQEYDLLKQNKELRIISLEERLELLIQIEGVDFPIKLKGTVDRIDELDGITRIIDYKTGKVEEKDLKVIDFDLLGSEYKYTKALQVLFYAYLFVNSKKHPNYSTIEAGIISFKNLNNGFLKLNFSEKRGAKENDVQEEHLTLFFEELKRIIIEILNPTIPFKQNENLPF